ncbi:MAG: hypothetical protein ACRD3M_14335 [Thermoanaerobaculia bacterium]
MHRRSCATGSLRRGRSHEARRALGDVPTQEPEDKPYGDRSAAVKDPSGNTWYLAMRIRDVAM